MLFAVAFLLTFVLPAQGAYLSTSNEESTEIAMREAVELYAEEEIDGEGVVKDSKVNKRGFERRSTPTDAEVKADYMAAHIRNRGSVSPTATNMKHIRWSNELAAVAQEWAETCSWSHNPDRSSKSPSFGYVGENKYLRTGNFNMTRSVDYWMLEASKYDYDTQTCSNGICTHYTQRAPGSDSVAYPNKIYVQTCIGGMVVWHNSEYVGCGIQFCSSMIGLDGWNNVYYHVCNYGPGGNYNGQDPYTSGTICADCSSDDPFCCKDNQCLVAETLE